MVTKTIDVPLPESLQTFLSQPVCITLPPPATVKINLPMGGTLQGVADVTKSIPDDCSLSFSLILQLNPFLAMLDCLFKIVKVLEPLINVVTGLSKPDPFAIAEAVPKLADAVPPLIECIAKFTGLGIPLFIKDLLCLIIKILGCVVGQLKTIVGFMAGLSIQIAAAEAQGNSELLAALECAQQERQGLGRSTCCRRSIRCRAAGARRTPARHRQCPADRDPRESPRPKICSRWSSDRGARSSGADPARRSPTDWEGAG